VFYQAKLAAILMEEESLKIIPPLPGAFFSVGGGLNSTAGND
jgi:hypothetical protein